MISFRYFTCILFFYYYTEAMGDFRKLSWGLKRNENEQLLGKFLTDVESHSMRNCPSRHTTIIAQKNNLLRSVTSIFKGRPYFVGTNPKIFVQSREYANYNCVFVFIDTIDYDYLSTIFTHLPSDYDTKLRIVSINNLLKDEVKNVLYLAYNKSIENVTMTFLENNAFKTFQVYPFTRSCKREVRLSYTWVPDKGLKQYYYEDNSPRNLHKCPVSISTLPLEDTITLRENPDGTLHILGGSEGNLILTFAEKLNFTLALKYPEIQDWDGVENNTIIGLLGEIPNRKAVIVFGKLRPTLSRNKYSDFTASYSHQCIVWTTAAITDFTKNVLYSEYDIYLWITIILSIIFSSVFIYNLSRISPSNRGRKTCIEVTFNVICSTLGIPLHRVPANKPGNVYYLSYIFYAMVITVAYRTSLASILTVNNNVQLIKNDEDIVRSGLVTGGSRTAVSVLKYQKNENPYVPYLIEHFEVVPDVPSALDRIKHKKDLAYMRHFSTMQFYKRNLTLSGKDIYFYSFDECIISFHVVAFVTKGSPLTDELNLIISSMLEFGFMDMWNVKNNHISRNTYKDNVKIQKLTLSQLQSIFMLYLVGIFLSTLILILEIILRILLKEK